VKVATWNVNGIRARATQLCDWVAEEKPDVLCLQELKAEPSQIPEECKLADYHVFWHGLRAYSGVSLHIRKEIAEDPQFIHPAFDMESRIVTAEVGNAVFASVYVPNGGKDYDAKVDFLNSLARWARQVRDDGKELVLCGDINVAHRDIDVHPKERKPGVIGQRPEERELFEKILATQLVDVCRDRDPGNAEVFSWWPPWRNMRQRNIGWRIDYILASPAIAARAEDCKVRAQIGTSDHAPVVMITTG
jgi:exodeoxyribonuclease-3